MLPIILLQHVPVHSSIYDSTLEFALIRTLVLLALQRNYYDLRVQRCQQVVRVTLRLTVSQSVCLGVEPRLTADKSSLAGYSPNS
jgi:hypothetical protein